MVVRVVHRKINPLQNIKYILLINRRLTVCKTGVIRGMVTCGILLGIP